MSFTKARATAAGSSISLRDMGTWKRAGPTTISGGPFPFANNRNTRGTALPAVIVQLPGFRRSCGSKRFASTCSTPYRRSP
jgi:hypothetical protein